MRDSTIGVALVPDKDYRLLGTQETLDGVKFEKSSRKLVAKPTRNRHEIPPVVSCNTGSSRPSRPTNVLRSASPIFIPGRPPTLKETGPNRLKLNCLRPCSYLLCGILIQLSESLGAEGGNGTGYVVPK